MARDIALIVAPGMSAVALALLEETIIVAKVLPHVGATIAEELCAGLSANKNAVVQAEVAEIVAEAKQIVDSAGGIVKSSVNIVSIEGNIVEIVDQGTRGKIEMMAEMVKEGDRLILKGAHIQGAGPGSSSFGELMGMARELGRNEGVKEVVIEGARRTTGAAVGKVPRPFTVKVD